MANTRGRKGTKKKGQTSKGSGAKKCPEGCKCGRHKRKAQAHGKKTVDNEGNEIVLQTRTEKNQIAFIEALRGYYGIIQPALDHVGITRATYRAWYNNQPEFRQKVDDVELEQRDFVKSKMIERINAGSDRMIEMYLTRRDPAFATNKDDDDQEALGAPTLKFIPATKPQKK